jgi:hypothetical protein
LLRAKRKRKHIKMLYFPPTVKPTDKKKPSLRGAGALRL